MKSIKLRKIGNSFGFTVREELIEKYNLKEGEELHVIENRVTYEGNYLHDTTVIRQIDKK